MDLRTSGCRVSSRVGVFASCLRSARSHILGITASRFFDDLVTGFINQWGDMASFVPVVGWLNPGLQTCQRAYVIG